MSFTRSVIRLISALLYLGHLWFAVGFQSNTFEKQIAMNDVCPKGNFVSTTSTGVVCKPCPSGTYMDKENRFDKCQRCRDCQGTHNHVVKKCSSTHNTKCKCSTGYFWDKELTYCSQCTKCKRGMGVERECGETNDTECKLCQKGLTFSDIGSLTEECRPCNECPEGFVLAKRCTRRNDTVCKLKITNNSKRLSPSTATEGTRTLGTAPGNELRSQMQWTATPTRTGRNETDVTEEQSGTDSVDVYRNIVVGAVVGVVLVAIVIVIVVLRKKCGRSSEQRKSKTVPPIRAASSSTTSVNITSNDEMENKRFSTAHYVSEKYLRDVSYSLIGDLSRHLNPEGRWKVLAGSLGFNSTDISNINIIPEQSTEKMLNRWGQRQESTLNHLYNVVKSLGWKHEASLIRKYMYLP